MRTVLKIAIALIALAAMSWCGLFIYWHLQIGNAIRQLEAEPSDGVAFQFLWKKAGCRALPHLAASLAPRKTPAFLQSATWLMAVAAENFEAKEKLQTPYKIRTPWLVKFDDSADERASKCDRAREYWRQNGPRLHQAWRIWSSECAR